MSDLLDFTRWPAWVNVATFAVAAVIVWFAGVRMTRLVDRFANRTGMSHGFAGMLLLGGIVSLTEISTVSTAAVTGSPLLALNNLLGSESINVFLLAAADPLAGREALTSFIAKPAMLFQGSLCIVLLAVVTLALVTGDHLVGGVGIWSTLLFVLCLGALWMSARYQDRRAWVAPGSGPDDEAEADRAETADDGDRRGKNDGVDAGRDTNLASLILALVGVAVVIIVSGFFLSLSGDALAEQSGLGQSFVGFVLVGTSTSLPELSTIATAIRLKRHDMAVGDILGSNVYNLLLIFAADVVYTGAEPVLNHAGRFEIAAALLGIVMTGILLLGMLERRNATVFRMGYDSVAMIVVFIAGLGMLYGLS